MNYNCTDCKMKPSVLKNTLRERVAPVVLVVMVLALLLPLETVISNFLLYLRMCLLM
jgi:hypothetical protein